MHAIHRAIIASLFGVFLCTSGHGAATLTTRNLEESKAPDDRNLKSLQISKEGNYYCSLSTFNHIDKVVVKPRTLTEQVLIYLSIQRDGSSEVRIHRSILNGILGQNDIEGMSTSQKKLPYMQLKGREITRRGDSVMADFEDNALRQAKQLDPSFRRTDLKFSGFRFRLGEHTGGDEDGQDIDVSAYLRIIVDWNDQAPHAKELSVYRAAYVMSQVPDTNGDKPPRELFYRFLPTHRPFQMLACVPVDALAI